MPAEVTLYPHQREAVEKLHNGSILCGGVGSGKSLTAIAYYFEKVCNNNPTLNLYIITTAKKRNNHEWEWECNNFHLSTNDELCAYDVNVVIDSWNNITKYTGVDNAFFIFDEQRVVGYGAWSKAFIKIAKKNKWILLSATPGDVWMDYVPVFIANGFYRNKSDFCERHVIWNPFVNFAQVKKYVNTHELVDHRNDILVMMYHKMPAEMVKETIICCYDQAKYRRCLTDRWNVFENRPIKNVSELYSCLRRVCSEDIDRREKLEWLLLKHPKVIIFYNFNYELEELKEICRGMNVPFAEYNGNQHDDTPEGDSWAYLIQYTAGAEGWNCITTDTIIFWSLSYSYKQMEQASGRINRLNTPFKKLYYFYLRSNSSVEKGIERALNNKRNFNEKSHFETLGKEGPVNVYSGRGLDHS